MESIAREIRRAQARTTTIQSGRVEETSFGTAAVRTLSSDSMATIPTVSNPNLTAGAGVVLVRASNDPQDVRILGMGGYAVP